MASIIEGHSPIGTPLTLFMVQLFVVVTITRILAYFIRFIKQPPVIAEVLTGIILGPSIAGHIPGFTNALFPSNSLVTFNVFANVGLILFMFIVGLELNGKLMKKNWKQSLLISITAMVAPFLLGIGSSYAIYALIMPEGSSFPNFLAFVSVALSITAFPILARIITDWKLMETNVGSIALSAAAVDDIVAWCVLALVVSIVKAHRPLDGLYTFLILFGFVIFMIVIVRPILFRLVAGRKRSSGVKFSVVVLILVLIFISAWFTEIIGVHSIFGAFILGMVTPRYKNFATKLTKRIEDIVIVLLLPLYFTYSGLQTNIGALNSATSWGMVFLVTAAACIGKIGGATLTAKLMKNNWRDSFTVGFLMNTKGLVELIVLNIGLEIGVLNIEVFTIFVIMALITTFMTTPMVYLIYQRKKKKEEEIEMEGKKSVTHNIMVHVQDVTVIDWMARVSHLLFENMSMKFLVIKEVTDRPSSYFFADIYHKPTAKFRSNNRGLANIMSKLQNQGVETESKILVSSDPTKDIVSYIDEKKFCLVMFEMRQRMEILSHSPSTLLRGLYNMYETLEHAFDWNTSIGGIVKHAIDHVESAIAVLIDKHEIPVKLNSILLLYMGEPYETYAVETALTLAKDQNLKLHILTNSQKFTLEYDVETKSNISIQILKSDLDIQVNPTNYDLVIHGADRNSKTIYKTVLVHQCTVPILILYAACTQKKSKISHLHT